MAGAINLNKKDDWQTPPELYVNICNYFAVSPVLDVCATDQNSLCKYHFSENSLERDYEYDFFMNPPYSEVKKWLRKAYLEHVKHNVNGIVLVFAKTDTSAFHDYVFGKAEILFLRGRVHFLANYKSKIWLGNNRAIKSKHGAPYGSCAICYRKKV